MVNQTLILQIGDLKKIVAAQTGTKAEKIRIQKWHANHPS